VKDNQNRLLVFEGLKHTKKEVLPLVEEDELGEQRQHAS